MDKIEKNIEQLYIVSTSCTICPKECKVNRLKNEIGYCLAHFNPTVASSGPHFGEETFISGTNGSGTIFISGCNLNCIYCQNSDISQKLTGKTYKPENLACLMLQLQSEKVHNINLVSPTHNSPAIAKAIYIAKKEGLTIPVVYNTGGFEKAETISLLEGLVDIYMPDFKYGSGSLSLKLSKVHNYPFYAGTSLKTMYTQVGPLKLENNIASRGVIIRHLVLPNYIDNSLSVLYLIKDMIGTNIHINIMDQYRPYYNAHSDKNLKREISADEFNYILNKAKELGFNIIR